MWRGADSLGEAWRGRQGPGSRQWTGRPEGVRARGGGGGRVGGGAREGRPAPGRPAVVRESQSFIDPALLFASSHRGGAGKAALPRVPPLGGLSAPRAARPRRSGQTSAPTTRTDAGRRRRFASAPDPAPAPRPPPRARPRPLLACASFPSPPPTLAVGPPTFRLDGRSLGNHRCSGQ